MEFSSEWKTIFPISSVFSPPLLLPNSQNSPLFFSPNTQKTHHLFQDTSLTPNLPPCYPTISQPRFLRNGHFTPNFVSKALGSQIPDYSSHFHGFNSLQLLRVPDKDYVIGFFPVGDNLGLIGFSLFYVKDGVFTVFERKRKFFSKFFNTAEKGGFCSKITRIYVNPVDDFGFANSSSSSSSRSKNCLVVVGFLMVCSEYSVCWYRIGVNGLDEEITNVSVALDYLGCADFKILKGCSVVSACWSPHLKEECVVLLGNGDFVLFEVNRVSSVRNERLTGVVVRGTEKGFKTRMRVSLFDKVSEHLEGSCGREWFGCEFSWHPRKVIVCCSTAVFLVDFSGECEVSCLLKMEGFEMVKDDGFMAVSRAGSDGFYYTVATKCLLLLCDVRTSMMPVLRWVHGVKNPRYMTVFRLSDLRANAEDDKYQLASETGYCILLGSFWDSEFRLFCYGPRLYEDSVSSEISKFCNSTYSWGIPSELLLSDRNCTCGSCLVKHEFSKSSLPVWIDWRQRKDLVLGFGVLEADISKQVSEPNSSGGFVMIRLMSSGKLEAQQYHARWELEKNCKLSNKRKHISSEDSHLYERRESEYDGSLDLRYNRFDYLQAFLDDNLAQFMVSKMEKASGSREDSHTKSKSDIHVEICQKLNDLGVLSNQQKKEQSNSTGVSLNVSDVFKDVSLPTSIREVALKSMWASLPTNVLQLGFSTYADFQNKLAGDEPLEFLDIPQQLQLPPFPLKKPSKRSNKWSQKVHPYDTLVGTIIPLQFLTTLNELIKEPRMVKEEFSTRLERKCDEILGVAKECVFHRNIKTEDGDHGSQNSDFFYHKPSAFMDSSMKETGYENDVFLVHVTRRNKDPAPSIKKEKDIAPSQKKKDPETPLSTADGQELLNMGCPVTLKFDNRMAVETGFGSKEVQLLRMLRKKEEDFRNGFKLYQDYIKGGSKLK